MIFLRDDIRHDYFRVKQGLKLTIVYNKSLFKLTIG